MENNKKEIEMIHVHRVASEQKITIDRAKEKYQFDKNGMLDISKLKGSESK